MTGQDAVNTAKAFNDRLNFSGVVLTKLDGDTAAVRRFPYGTP
jgi:signal recognition particle subunit SRP54